MHVRRVPLRVGLLRRLQVDPFDRGMSAPARAEGISGAGRCPHQKWTILHMEGERDAANALLHGLHAVDSPPSTWGDLFYFPEASRARPSVQVPRARVCVESSPYVVADDGGHDEKKDSQDVVPHALPPVLVGLSPRSEDAPLRVLLLDAILSEPYFTTVVTIKALRRAA